MFKNAIAPIQAWLLSQDRCVGCGKYLSEGKVGKHKKGSRTTCSCGRIFIKNKKTGKYRRALISEV